MLCPFIARCFAVFAQIGFPTDRRSAESQCSSNLARLWGSDAVSSLRVLTMLTMLGRLYYGLAGVK